MGFKDSIEYGIDYREYKNVPKLPIDVNLTAIAGVWGDYSNIRCLFKDKNGNKYMRNIKGYAGNYLISELGINAKEIKVGDVFVVSA